MAYAHREISTARFSVARVLLSLLVCCRCLQGGSRSSCVGPVEAAAGGTASSSSRQHNLHRHQQWRSSSSCSSYAPCFVTSGTPVQGSRIRGDGGSHGGVGCRSRSRKSSGRVMTMNTTRAKRGAAGRGRSKTGVSKKARRILEPASREETAYEEKKEKVSSMNWGNLGKSGGGAGKRGKAGRGQAGPSSSSYGGPAGGAAAASEDAAGLDAAWKEAALPRAGDELKCRHFKACAGCEFDRRFDETPIMVDSRQERNLEFRSSTLALRASFMDSLHSTGARARGGAK
ncbi:unnamed protein product, partial [Ectocarpus sp. 8 AP-2014]